MRDIFLLSPYCSKKYEFPQSSLEYIRLYLSDHGYAATIIDCAFYDEDLSYIIERLNIAEKPIVGITAYTRERFNAYKLIKKIKSYVDGVTIVTGGRHFGFLPEETLTELPEVDIVVRGEGEITFKSLCDKLMKDESVSDVLGISYRLKGRVIHNEDRPMDDDIDQFKNFDYEEAKRTKPKLLFPTKLYHRGHFTVSTTRGCPNSCVFCSLNGSKVRRRSIENIMTEIKQKIELTGCRNVSFIDSSLTLNKTFIQSLCEKIIEGQLNITWNCYSRVDIDLNLLSLMKQAGLSSVEIGLESGSPRVLKAVRKRINLKQVEKFCKEAYRLGIKAYIFCMISLPEEDVEDVNNTIEFIKRIGPFVYKTGIQTTRILPDAALYQIAKEKRVLDNSFSWFKDYVNPYTAKEKYTNPLYDSLPLYIEKLDIETINRKKDEFYEISDIYMMHGHTFFSAVLDNLKLESLRKLTPRIAIRKTRKLFRKLYGLVKTKYVKMKSSHMG